MSFSSLELSEIASVFYLEFSNYIDSYQDRQVAKAESLHEYEKRDDLSIRLNNYRWFWEDVHLANKLESLKRYTKYGESQNITHDEISVSLTPLDVKMPLKELYTKLRLVRYNSSEFLTHEHHQKLENYISMVANRLIRENLK